MGFVGYSGTYGASGNQYLYRGKIREINLDNSISLFIWGLNSELSKQKDQCQTKSWNGAEGELGMDEDIQI